MSLLIQFYYPELVEQNGFQYTFDIMDEKWDFLILWIIVIPLILQPPCLLEIFKTQKGYTHIIKYLQYPALLMYLYMKEFLTALISEYGSAK